MENSKSNDLLARLRNVTLDDSLQLSDFWPANSSQTEAVDEKSFQSDRLDSFMASLNAPSPAQNSGSYFTGVHPESKPESMNGFSGSTLFGSGSIENQENPFAKMSRKRSGLASGLPKLVGWRLNTSFLGVLSLICGGSLTAWSILAKSGTHSMTSLGLSLTISGLLMLVLVVICQTAFRTSGQT